MVRSSNRRHTVTVTVTSVSVNEKQIEAPTLCSNSVDKPNTRIVHREYVIRYAFSPSFCIVFVIQRGRVRYARLPTFVLDLEPVS